MQTEPVLGLRLPGDRWAHYVGEELRPGELAIAVCGRDIRLYPLEEGAKIQHCSYCKMYHETARIAGGQPALEEDS